MKLKHILVTLLTLCLLLTITACDQVDDPPANDTTADITTEAPTGSPTESNTETPTEAPAPTAFPITVRVEGKGAVTFNNDDVVETLTKDLTTSNVISLTADPAEGYILKGWFEETDGERKLLHEEGSVTFTVPAREVTLVAIFEKAFLLEVFSDNPDAGVFTANGEELTEKDWYAAEQTAITLTAVPAEGYIFDAWYEIDADGNESRYANEATVEVSYGQIDRTLFCRFIKVYKGTLLIEGQGTVTLDGNPVKDGDSVTLKAGELLSVTATPAEGYTFKGWYQRKDGQDTFLDDIPNPNFIMPQTDCVIVAVFEEILSMTVKVEDQTKGYIKVQGVNGTFTSYNMEGKGTTATLTAVPVEGYEFHYWTVEGTQNILSVDATYSVTLNNVNHNTTLVAVFRPILPLTIRTTEGGRVTVDGSPLSDTYSGKLASYTEFKVTAVPDEGYSFVGLYTVGADGKPDKAVSTAGGAILLVMPEEAYDLVAVFKSDFKGFVTTVTCDETQGVFRVEGFDGTFSRFEDTHPEARTYTLTAVAAPGYRFKGWYQVDGDQETLLLAEESICLAQRNKDITVEARFERVYNVKFRVEGNGTFIANGQNVDGVLNVQLAVTDYMTLKAVAPADTRFVGWYEVVDGDRKLLYDQPDVIFTVPARECTILAVFEDAHYLSINSAQGQFMLEGSETLYSDYSDHVYLPYEFTVIAQAPEGYRFDGWYEVRGDEWILLTNDLTYSGQMPDRDLHINARFEELYTVTIQLHGDWKVLHEESGITYADTFTLDLAKDEIFTLTIPWSGEWELEGWYTVGEDGKIGNLISRDSIECQFTVIGDMTVTPQFLPKYTLTVKVEDEIGSFTVDGSEEAYTNWGATAAGPYTYTVTAIAPVGYVFSGWYEVMGGDIEDVLLSESVTYSVTVDGNDRVILPRFTVAEDVLFTLRVMDDMGASFLLGGEEIPGDGWEKDVPYGSTMTVTVILEEGYTFEGWYIEYYDEEYQIYYAFYSDELTITYTCLEEYCALVVFVKGGPTPEGDIPPVIN